MTSPKRSPRANTPVVPEDALMKKALHLPMPGPGILISVPLALLPQYLELYQLTPMTRGEVRDLLTATREPRRQVLYVRRTKTKKGK